MSNSNADLEYCYTIDPAWATEAVVCTTSGVELNFEKLSLLCPSEDLPHQISIQLTSSQNNNERLKGQNIPETPQKYRDTGFPDRIQKQSHAPVQQSLKRTARSDRADSPGPKNESIIQREIRLQQEREEDLKRERQFLQGLKVADDSLTRDSADFSEELTNGYKYTTEHPMKSEIDRVRVREDELRDMKGTTNTTRETTLSGLQEHRYRDRRQSLESTASSSTTLSTPTTASSQDSNLNSSPTNTAYDTRPRRSSKIVSPICTADNKSPSTWYTSESPIERDIRITKEREMEHKSRLE